MSLETNGAKFKSQPKPISGSSTNTLMLLIMRSPKQKLTELKESLKKKNIRISDILSSHYHARIRQMIQLAVSERYMKVDEEGNLCKWPDEQR
jgi:hypothetical protein